MIKAYSKDYFQTKVAVTTMIIVEALLGVRRMLMHYLDGTDIVVWNLNKRKSTVKVKTHTHTYTWDREKHIPCSL